MESASVVVKADEVIFDETAFLRLSHKEQLRLVRSFNRVGLAVEAAYLTARDKQLQPEPSPDGIRPVFRPVLQSAMPQVLQDGTTGQAVVLTQRMLHILKRYNRVGGGTTIGYADAAIIAKQWWRPINWYCWWKGMI